MDKHTDPKETTVTIYAEDGHEIDCPAGYRWDIETEGACPECGDQNAEKEATR